MKPGHLPQDEFHCGTEDVSFHFKRLNHNTEPSFAIGDIVLARLIDVVSGQREIFVDKVNPLLTLDLAMRLATAQGVAAYLKQNGNHDIIPFIVIDITEQAVVLQDDNLNVYFGNWTDEGGLVITIQTNTTH